MSNIDQIISQQTELPIAVKMTKVYNWMIGGLGLTSAVAYFTNSSGLVYEIGGIALLVIFLATLGLVMFISSRVETMSYGTLLGSFLAYSALNGVTFSLILMKYTGDSVMGVFSFTALAFTALSIYGRVTKKDLSGVGSFMIMGLFGIIIATLINIFLQSSLMYTTISILGVLIFAGLTAYDSQKIKEVLAENHDEATLKKLYIFFALDLYLDFINLFLFLLRLLGDRK